MENRTSKEARGYPLKVMGLVLFFVFVAEGLIMLLLPWLTNSSPGSLAESLTDATLLALVLMPALWFVIVQPLRRVMRDRGLLLRRVLDAQERERSNLGRDLHDELGQQLTALLVGLRALGNQTDSPELKQRAERLLPIASASLEQVRSMARGLRAGVLEDFGISVAIERLCEEFCESHSTLPEFHSNLAGDRRFDREIEIALYRLCQAALTNIARHAEAKAVRVNLNELNDSLTLEVVDDGRGFDVKTAGASPDSMGLKSMRERIELLGGTWHLQSARGAGTQIKVSLPVSAPEQVKA